MRPPRLRSRILPRDLARRLAIDTGEGGFRREAGGTVGIHVDCREAGSAADRQHAAAGQIDLGRHRRVERRAHVVAVERRAADRLAFDDAVPLRRLGRAPSADGTRKRFAIDADPRRFRADEDAQQVERGIGGRQKRYRRGLAFARRHVAPQCS